MKLSKQELNVQAKQAVIGQLADRGHGARLKREGRSEYLWVEDRITAKVHAKQKAKWPALKGTGGKDFLILVDYEKSYDKPGFYILSRDDWKETAQKDLNERIRDGRHTKGDAKLITSDYIPQHTWQHLKGTGEPFTGTDIGAQQVSKYKDRWDKIERMLGKE